MKKTTQMRINNQELKLIYDAIICKVKTFIDHYRDDGSPVFIYTDENEDTLSLCYKIIREMHERGLYNA